MLVVRRSDKDGGSYPIHDRTLSEPLAAVLLEIHLSATYCGMSLTGTSASSFSLVFFYFCIVFAAVHAVMRCPSVRLSVTFVYPVEMNKHRRIFKILSPSVTTPFYFFPYQTLYSDANHPPNEGVECRWDRQKSRFSTNIWLHRVLSAVRPPI